MSRLTTTLIALALTLTGTSACDEATEAAFGADGEVALRPGGFGSNGGVLLNTSANGEWAIDHLDVTFGNDLDDVILDGVELPGKEKGTVIKLKSVWAEKGQLMGESTYGTHKGDEFKNSVWYLRTPKAPGAVKRTMTISQYTVDPEGLHRYVFMYPNDVTYGKHLYTLQGGSNTYKENKENPPQNIAVCAPDPETGGSLEALVYDGLYVDMKSGHMTKRDSTLMIACVSGGVGKAGLWGFLPYAYGLEALQTATRAVRADYCGDGTSYTKPGNALYMEDRFGIHDFGQGAGNETEAIWRTDGAACVNVPRDANFSYASVDCGGWTPKWCEVEATMNSFGGEALIHTKIP